MALLPREQHFGDLLGSVKASEEREKVLALFEEPLDRLILTADGTLQLLVSAWHNRVVQVRVLKHLPNFETSTVHREIELHFADDPNHSVFCVARSQVRFGNNDLMEKAKAFGIGQLFREWDILPEFELVDAGKEDEGINFWRKYRLSGEEVECLIHETFPGNPLHQTLSTMTTPVDTTTSPLGLTSDARYLRTIPTELSAIQRIFCTANGNVQRIARALLGETVDVKLQKETKIRRGEYQRDVELSGSSTCLVCKATSRITIGAESVVQDLENGKLQLGAIIKYVRSYPKFELLGAQWFSSRKFSRNYVLKLDRASVELHVTESFDWEEDHPLALLSRKYL